MMKRTIFKVIFWIAILFIAIAVFSLTVAQELPYEFADYKLQQHFYDVIIQGLPVAVLVTLFGTIKRKNSKVRNWTYVSLTILLSIICFVSQLFLLFSFGFGSWTTMSTVYRHKSENREIKEQLYDIGAFGYGGRRTVEIKPFLNYWILPTSIDTLKINKSEWKSVQEEGDIKTP